MQENEINLSMPTLQPAYVSETHGLLTGNQGISWFEVSRQIFALEHHLTLAAGVLDSNLRRAFFL